MTLKNSSIVSQNEADFETPLTVIEYSQEDSALAFEEDAMTLEEAIESSIDD